MRIRKKYQRKRIPKFKKYYSYNLQDSYLIEYESLLQKIHTKIAKEIFCLKPNINVGEWQIEFEGLTIFYDPEFGSQAEIAGSSILPLSKRLIIHIWLLDLLKKRHGVLKAVKLCLKKLIEQSKDLRNLKI